MNIKEGWRLLVFITVLIVSSSVLYAGDSVAPLIRTRASALVTVQSVSVAGSAESRVASIDKITGRVRIDRQKKPINYNRSGGGVILSSNGIIVTNAHTVRDAAGIFVTFYDGVRVPGRLIRIMPGDLAFLLVVPPFKLTAIPFADSDKVSKGMFVYTRGNSLWHHDTLFRGKVTGVALGILHGGPHITVLQTVFGSEFYLGDSGCPVLDRKGALLGLVIGGRRDGDKATFSVTSNVIRDAYQKISEYSPGSSGGRLEPNASGIFLDRLRKISNEPRVTPAAL